MSVRDNGIGFPDVLPEKKGMGLQTMRYRAALIGATLSILKVPFRRNARGLLGQTGRYPPLEGNDNGKDAEQTAARNKRCSSSMIILCCGKAWGG